MITVTTFQFISLVLVGLATGMLIYGSIVSTTIRLLKKARESNKDKDKIISKLESMFTFREMTTVIKAYGESDFGETKEEIVSKAKEFSTQINSLSLVDNSDKTSLTTLLLRVTDFKISRLELEN